MNREALVEESVWTIGGSAPVSRWVCGAGGAREAKAGRAAPGLRVAQVRGLDEVGGDARGAAWNLRHSVKVGRFFPSTKLCAECGALNPNLNLSDRTWLCASCGTQHDRDLNASRNIFAEGLRLVAAGQTETLNARGEPVSLPRGSTAL
jgi:Putative transposase DNA-binding domain